MLIINTVISSMLTDLNQKPLIFTASLNASSFTFEFTYRKPGLA